MSTRNDFQALARLRLKEAEHLYKERLYDGCAYLCGYVIELALKARICRILKLQEYPEKGELGRVFKTHDFEVLKLLAGLQSEISITKNVRLFENWSIVTNWRPEQRYTRPGTYVQAQVNDILTRIKENPERGIHVAYKTVVTQRAKSKIREMLSVVTHEKGDFYLAMLAQSSPEISDRWTLVVSAPWIDATGSSSAVSYLSEKLKSHLDKSTLSSIDRISPLFSSSRLVNRIVHFLGMRISLDEEDEHVRNWIAEDAPISEAFIFIANPTPVGRRRKGGAVQTRTLAR